MYKVRLFTLYHFNVHSRLTKLSRSSLYLAQPFVLTIRIIFKKVTKSSHIFGFRNTDHSFFRQGVVIFFVLLLLVAFNEGISGQCPANFNIPNQIDCKGNIVDFEASFTPGGTNFDYQWERERPGEVSFSGIEGAGGNTNTSPIQLHLTNIGVGGTDINQSKYRLKITCSDGVTVFSTNEATLTVNSITAISGLKNNILCTGQNISFQVTTEGTVPISYQWIKHQDVGWSDVKGETGQTLTLNNLLPADAGEYTVRAIFPVTEPPGSSHCTETNYNITRSIVVTPTITGPAIACVNSDDNVYTTETYSTSNTGNTFLWTVAGGSFTGQGTNQIVVTWTTAGTGSVSVTETIGAAGCNATSTLPVTINAAPNTTGIFHN